MDHYESSNLQWFGWMIELVKAKNNCKGAKLATILFHYWWYSIRIMNIKVNIIQYVIFFCLIMCDAYDVINVHQFGIFLSHCVHCLQSGSLCYF
jgi:hypothetical protein